METCFVQGIRRKSQCLLWINKYLFKTHYFVLSVLKKEIQCTKIIPISKAKQMIQEFSINQNQYINSYTQSLVDDLQELSNQLMDYQNQVISTIDIILGVVTQWIKDLDGIKGQMNNNNLLKQLQELHQNNKDSQNYQQTIDKIKNAHSNKLLKNLQNLYNQDDLNKCDQHLKQILNKRQNEKNTLININQVANIHNKPIIKMQEQEVINIPKKCELINNVKQDQDCYAIAFNKTGSIMVSGCHYYIKVWQFDKGKLTELNKLTGHTDRIYCLVFSKNLNWFISGSGDSTLRGWKEQYNNWISTQPQQQHSYSVYCLLINSNENELISGLICFDPQSQNQNIFSLKRSNLSYSNKNEKINRFYAAMIQQLTFGKCLQKKIQQIIIIH